MNQTLPIVADNLPEWDSRGHEALKDWLSSQPVSVLVEFLMESARNDEVVRVVLRCLAEPTLSGQQNADRLRRAIQFLTSVPNPEEFPHRQSDQIQYRLNWLLFLLGAIWNRGHQNASESVELALERSEIRAEKDIDSEYGSESVRGELLKLLCLGCARARPAPMALALRWARMRRSSRLGWFDDFTEAYADVLGADGLAAHQRALTMADETLSTD
ncbi:MAG: hypothetical protein JNK85_11595 [Verrucomicrobiales bacterium]|nr:hypothetical protein [Verrucomicrobiales bacterium]